jgi:hypothetical protein
MPTTKREHYNPKSNAFGALTTNGNDTNDNDNDNANPQTMAERLKKSLALQQPQPLTQQKLQPPSQMLTLPDLPPRPQFWWQDEDD